MGNNEGIGLVRFMCGDGIAEVVVKEAMSCDECICVSKVDGVVSVEEVVWGSVGDVVVGSVSWKLMGNECSCGIGNDVGGVGDCVCCFCMEPLWEGPLFFVGSKLDGLGVEKVK